MCASSQAKKRALAAVGFVSIDDPERVYRLYPHEVSGGAGQRAIIAMMLIVEPDVLIADEPTCALDASVQAQVLNLLEDLRWRRGLTFIMVSYDLAVVTHQCERWMAICCGAACYSLNNTMIFYFNCSKIKYLIK